MKTKAVQLAADGIVFVDNKRALQRVSMWMSQYGEMVVVHMTKAEARKVCENLKRAIKGCK